MYPLQVVGDKFETIKIGVGSEHCNSDSKLFIRVLTHYAIKKVKLSGNGREAKGPSIRAVLPMYRFEAAHNED